MTARAFDPIAHGKAMRAGGFWLDRTLDEFIVEGVAKYPNKVAFSAYRADRGTDPVRTLTYAELGDLVARAAGSLRALGVGAGDVVAVQLPNWWEFAVIMLACGRLGALPNPLMPIFRERELSYMLGFAEAKVFVVPKSFRGFDHAAMGETLKKELPQLKHVIVVDGDGETSFDRMLLSGKDRVDPPKNWKDHPLDPSAPSVLMFTSGTTGSPKGALHTSNTMVACTFALAGRFGLTPDDVLHISSPVGHMMGYAAGVCLSLRLNATAVLQDTWEPKRGVEIMSIEGSTFMAAATPFLTDICNAVASGSPRPEKLRSFLCGGAPIPPAVIERAKKELGLAVCSLWGMTESLSSTLTEPSRAHDKSATTDGRPLEGVEVRIVDPDSGTPLPNGTSGRLMVRGAQNFIGYYKRADLQVADGDGWFDTGDLAYMDDDGYIRISGRTKDVLIRGGENVPVFEIESLLYQHPAIADAAIVGYPEPRLGERACAFVVLREGKSLDLADVQKHMSENRVAKQYWPEALEVVKELPRTPSGKVQKFKLRDVAKDTYGS